MGAGWVRTIVERGVASNSASSLLAIFVLVLCLAPPTGIWLDGEQHYLWLARQWVGDGVPEHSALLDGMPHAYVFLSICGALIKLFGDVLGQILLHVLVAAAYAYAITRLTAVLGLRLIEVILLLLAFVALDQGLFAGEWLFKGVEPKVFAYPFILIATAELLQQRLIRACVFLAVATHMHLLVGGFWTIILAISALALHRNLRAMLLPSAIYALAVLPLLAILISTGYLDTQHAAAGAPSASWISTYIRMPHHATPWIDRYTVLSWLPSILALLVLTVISTKMRHWLTQAGAQLSVVVVAGGCFLFLALMATALDPSGSIGSTTPFRPSSLVLFYFLMLMILLLQAVAEPRRWQLTASTVMLLAAFLAPGIGLNALRPIRDELRARAEFGALLSFAQKTPVDTMFLIWPDLEPSLYWFERESHRPLLIVRKFIPARGASVREWYKRRTFQDQVFAGGCPLPTTYHVDVLIVPAALASRYAACSSVVASREEYAVLDLRPAADRQMNPGVEGGGGRSR
jgi:hypothetical protein